MLIWSQKKGLKTAIRQISHELRSRGIKLRVGRNFDLLRAEIARDGTRHDLLKQFNPDGVLYKSQAAFWICGYGLSGQIAFTQAEQLLDLDRSSVADYLRTHKDDYIPASPPVDQSSVRTIRGPKASRLTGRICYSGETWLHKDIRDKGTAHLVVQLGAFCASVAWDPDAIFGLMHWSLASDGFNNRVGFMHSEPMTMCWRRTDTEAEHQVWLVYTEREDLQFMIDFNSIGYAQKLVRKFR